MKEQNKGQRLPGELIAQKQDMSGVSEVLFISEERKE